METEKYTRLSLSPFTAHLLQTDKQLYITLFQTGGQLFHPTGLSIVLCLARLIHSNRRRYLCSFDVHSSILTSDTQQLAQMASMCTFGSAVTFGWNLGLGYLISATWLHMLEMFLLMLDW